MVTSVQPKWTTKLQREDVLQAIIQMQGVMPVLERPEFRGAVIAGGFLRAVAGSEEIADIDIFVPSSDMADSLAVALAAALTQSGEHLEKTEHAYTIHTEFYPVQVIHRWLFDSPSAVIDGFDFTATMAALWYGDEGWTSTCHPGFYKAIRTKTLFYTSPDVHDGVGSAMRMFKYLKRGYDIEMHSYAKVLGRLVKEAITTDMTEAQASDAIAEAFDTEEQRRMGGNY